MANCCATKVSSTCGVTDWQLDCNTVWSWAKSTCQFFTGQAEENTALTEMINSTMPVEPKSGTADADADLIALMETAEQQKVTGKAAVGWDWSVPRM